MTLSEWMDREGYGVAELARDLGTSEANVSRWRAGRLPLPGWIMRIHAFTKGAVDANSWYGLTLQDS
jgi:hypothetical protein